MGQERFTARLEAFSDLVFGFSLSLLATRLDVPAKVEDIFEPTRWLAIIGTFGFVCRFWLEHYRIFRHRFVAGMFDAVVNFIFLFAIAILPYAVQTFLRFQLFLPSFALYIGDFSLILLTLSTLRVRCLRQRRADPDVADRLREWRRSIVHFTAAILMCVWLLVLQRHRGAFGSGMPAGIPFAIKSSDLDPYIVGAFVLVVFLSRRLVRRLPAFLAS